MALKQTIDELKNLLSHILQDLEKSETSGNKAASQRVRTGTIRLEKVAKLYRKESIKDEKSNKGKKKPLKKTAKKPAAKKTAAKKTAAKKMTAAKKPVAKKAAAKNPAVKKPAAKKAAVKRSASTKKVAAKKPAAKKTTAGARALTVKRKQTAKLPKRRAAR